MLLAHHLYDLAVCGHRVALDARLDRALRTPPDPSALLLYEAGDRFEAEIGAALGWPEVVVEDGDFAAAAERTLSLLKAGAPGVLQGVLLDEGRLAKPDLLERVEGESALGSWHYVPGDVKSALAARTDAALQIGFAALLLEKVQGRRPAEGVIVLGDGRRERFPLDAIRYSIDDAVARAEAIARGVEETAPFFSRACARCRWRGTCLPELRSRRDLSFVHGTTPSLARALAARGVATIDELAACDPAALRAAGAPADGLERLRRQARATIEGRAIGRRSVPVPRGRGACWLRIECDPLDQGEPYLFAWASGSAAPEAAVAEGEDERRGIFLKIVAAFEEREDGPIYTYGRETARAFDRLGDRAGAEAARLGDLEGRIVDLAPWVRRAAALPVFHYAFEEVAAFVEDRARPMPDDPVDERFVRFASRDPEALRAIEAEGRSDVASLRRILSWLAEGA